MAGIAQEAPAQRAQAARATGEEAPQGGAAVGARGQPQGPAVDRQLAIQVGQDAAGLRLHDAADRVHGPQPVEAAEVEHQPTGQGHALAVVAGAGTPQRQRHPVAGAGAGHRHHLLQPLHLHGHLGAAALEQRFQHG